MIGQTSLLRETLLRAVSALALAGEGLGGCASLAAESKPTPEGAVAFTDRAESELSELYVHQGRVDWVYQNFITEDTAALVEHVNTQVTQTGVRLAGEAARYYGLELDETTARKLKLLRLGLTLPAPATDGAAAELAAITTRLSSAYSTGRIDLDGREATLDELEVLMRETRDPQKLEEIWTKWRDVAKPMAGDYAQMVTIANAGARDLGFDDVGQMWLSKYDMTPEVMAAEVERLWTQMRPLYVQLHCHVRARLNARYGDAIVPLDAPIRADLLGNMWAQDWSALYDMVGPPAADPGYDLTVLLNERDYDAVALTRAGERFYTSLGLEPLPDTFWTRSLLTRPADREVVCHASAWDIDYEDDIRIKMCIHVDADDFRTVHHELGHNYYQRAYKAQPFLFRDGANDGFHEAIGDFIALNVTPEYLVQIGLLPADRTPSAQADLGLLMNVALDKIAFLPFAYTMDSWRWGVFSGDIEPAQYNSTWWAMSLANQGIRPPDARPADAFDPGAKYHIANNVPYLRYFLSYVLQFQFYKAACAQAGWEGPLNRCSVYANEEVGAHFNAMLAMGASRPWPEALEAFTGTRELDATALVDYFAPLTAWLEEENSGRQCGW